VLELAFQPDRESREPVYRQLGHYLRDLIDSRRLPPAERLPPSRDLAATLGLSRNTVSQAYRDLIDEGLLHAQVGRGTFVAARAGARSGPRDPGEPERGFAWGGLLARRNRALELPRAFAGELGPVRLDFRGGQVDLASLPLAELKRAHVRAVDQLHELADHRDPRGWPPLREAVAQALVARGIRCAPDDVAIVNGAQQALDLLARVLVDPGDSVVMEDPGYFGARFAFAAAEAHVLGVGVDADGLRTDELARLLRARRVKLLFTTPAVQSPTGVALAPARRRELLELADTYQLPVIEDDYDCELRYGSPPVPALKNLDDAGRVVYVGTFSKALFGGVRVGYVVAPRPLLWRLVLSRFATDFQTDLVAQAVVADLMVSGGLERHVRRVRRLYASRREAMLEALARHMPEGVRWQPPAGGSAVWVSLPPEVDPDRLLERARGEGIAYARGDVFHLEEQGGEHLSLSFARLDEAAIEEGVERLGRGIRTCAKGGTR
jgi:GntR family transcriptional regulator/MocR family aminotransferase